MRNKTLTRADLAEAVVEKVGLPRNESQEPGRARLEGDIGRTGGWRVGQAVVFRLIRYPREG